MPVRTFVEGTAAFVVLDWPEKRNAMGPAECEAFVAALTGIADAPEIVVWSSPARAPSAPAAT